MRERGQLGILILIYAPFKRSGVVALLDLMLILPHWVCFQHYTAFSGVWGSWTNPFPAHSCSMLSYLLLKIAQNRLLVLALVIFQRKFLKNFFLCLFYSQPSSLVCVCPSSNLIPQLFTRTTSWVSHDFCFLGHWSLNPLFCWMCAVLISVVVRGGKPGVAPITVLSWNGDLALCHFEQLEFMVYEQTQRLAPWYICFFLDPGKQPSAGTVVLNCEEA